jgi:flagellar P-ring protein precursor FlgI
MTQTTQMPPYTRIKDVAEVSNLRDNHLMGMGLVVGLKGTGDKSDAAVKALQNLLKRQKFQITNEQINPGNIALVMVTASLPPLSRKGTRLDATIASLADAKSLSGGILLATFLKGLDDQVYAVAQGVLSQTATLPTIAIATSGAIVEREVPVAMVSPQGTVSLRLTAPDFNTAVRIAGVINQHFGTPCAQAMDLGLVQVAVPKKHLLGNRVSDFIAEIFNLPVATEVPARVVINERTGTVIMGESVTLRPVTISHNQITIHIRADNTEQGCVTVQKLVTALAAMQVSTKDLVDIFRMLKRAGALHAELIIS